jgi:hypothetical protein
LTLLGHNSADLTVSIKVRAFNSMTRFCDPERLEREISYPVGATIGDIVRDFNIPLAELFLILVNGRDVAPGCVGDIRLAHQLEDGDVIALSGPVPYSFGYGAPVV